MAIRATFYCTQPKSEKSTIRCRVEYTPDLLSFKTSAALGRGVFDFSFVISRLTCRPQDFASQRVKHKVSGARELNARIDEVSERAKTLHTQFVKDGKLPSPEMFKLLIQEGEKEVVTTASISEGHTAFVKYLEDNDTSEKFINDAKRAFALAKEYCLCEGLPFSYEVVSVRWMAGLRQFIANQVVGKFKKKRRNANTVRKYVKRFQRFFSFSLDEGFYSEDTLRKFRLEGETKSFPVNLKPDEIEAFYKVDLSKVFETKKSLDNATACRDLFVFATQCGIRYSEWYKLQNPTGVSDTGVEYVSAPNGYNIRFIQEKTEGHVEAPLSGLAMEILEKYNRRLPRPLTPASMLKYLQTIADAAKIEKHVTTHTARRSFASNMERAGASRSAIMRITGHKSEKDYLRYVGIETEENADLLRKAMPATFRVV